MRGKFLLLFAISSIGIGTLWLLQTEQASGADTISQNAHNDSGMIITPLQFQDRTYSSATLQDWSPDGSVILLRYDKAGDDHVQTFNVLALARPDLSNVMELALPQEFQSGEMVGTPPHPRTMFPIRALFSPAYRGDSTVSGWDVFFQWKDDLYAFSFDNSKLEKLMSGIAWFDVTSSPDRLVYNKYDENNSVGTLSEFDVKTKQSHPILQKIPRMFAFDLSPDDSKVLYVEGGQSRGDNGYLVYRDLASGQRNTVPNVGFGPGTLRWTVGGSNFILVDRSEWNTAHGGWLGGGINVASLDGKTNAALIPESIDNPRTLVMSPDGKSIIVQLQPQSVNGVLVNGTLTSVGHGDLFRVDYPKVIPEFGSIITLLMAAGTVGAIVLAGRLKSSHKR